MAKSVIAYDRDLPEIPDRRPWEKPTSFLIKGEEPGSWLVDDSGRRPSNLLLVNKLRAAVDTWREEGYPGASDITQWLFEYWFEEDHEVPGFPVPFRYHFCQREAIETLAYIVEVAQIRDAKVLVNVYAQVFKKDLFEYNLVHETTMDGKRRLRRYFPELDAEGVQDLPPENLARYAFKMATGSGKTWVIAMVAVWSHFHKKRVPGSPLVEDGIHHDRDGGASGGLSCSLSPDSAGTARLSHEHGNPAGQARKRFCRVVSDRAALRCRVMLRQDRRG